MEKILVTGGAGYIGSTLMSELLKWNKVTVYDTLMYGGDSIMPLLTHSNMSFIYGDVQDYGHLNSIIKNYDIVINLAAIVGYSACRKNPSLAFGTNKGGVENIVKSLADQQLFIHASTGSNYGVIDGICTEDSPLNPLSIYAESKTEAEPIARQHENSIIYRFATAFGVSPRLRLDLLINELVYLSYTQKYLAVYEPHFMRTFIHVRDIAKAIVFAIDHQDIMRNNTYNVGADKLNLSKRQICDLIQSKLKVDIHYTDFDTDADKRNYVVSYNKLNSLGFSASIGVDEGIDELLKIMPLVDTRTKYKN